MGKTQDVRVTITITAVMRDCKTCAIRGRAEKLGLCSWCVSLVQEVNGNGNLWVYKKAIIEGEIVYALPKDLLKVPELLLIE